jgi:uncharacterized protein (TIGR03086 family)
MELYQHAQDEFEKALAAMTPSDWDKPSTCPGWTVRDIAGHVTWAQHQLLAWATGAADPSTPGGPGTPHPAEVLAGGDPLTEYRKARAEANAVLTEETLARKITLPGMGEVPIAAVVALLVCDTTVHTWDLGHPVGQKIELPEPLVTAAHDWAKANVVRMPGFFGPEVTPPPDADAQTRLLAFVGRA